MIMIMMMMIMYDDDDDDVDGYDVGDVEDDKKTMVSFSTPAQILTRSSQLYTPSSQL